MNSVSSRGKMSGFGGNNNDSVKKQAKKVIMHVNQFIPFFMQYHLLSSQCLSEFSKDYHMKESAMYKNQLIDFDTKLIEIFNQRRDRYIRKFYP
jgi:hypothetical protein